MAIRFGVWNIEWMNDLFTGDTPPVFKPDSDEVRGPRHDNTVAQRRADIAGVINDLALDALVVVEGPNRVEELQLFFDQAAVNGDWLCAVQPSGAQSVGLAVRVDQGRFDNPPFVWFDVRTDAAADALRLATEPFQMDSDGDGLDEVHKYERRPLYAELRPAGGRAFRVLGVHLKSKGIFDSLEWAKWWARSEGNNRRLLAQCYHLRQDFLDAYLSDPATRDMPMIICGDINDGPGFDAAEMKLAASGVETLMGSVWNGDLCLGNAIYDALPPARQATLDFRDLSTTSYKDPLFDDVYQRAWIDHILYTRRHPGWVTGGIIHRDMPDGQPIYRKFPAASDHYPVVCSVA